MDTSQILNLLGHNGNSKILELLSQFVSLFYFIYFFVFLPFLGPLPTAYGGSQARGLIGAVATGLHHSHSNAISELHLQPTPQLTAMPDP